MKLISVLLLAAVLQVSAHTHAQETITYSGKNVAIEKMFSVIREQTGYKFFYDEADVKNGHPVTIELIKVNLETALQKIFIDQPLQYKVEGKTIFISRKEGRSADKIAPPIDVRGRVVDENGNPVVASITVKGSNIGTVSNSKGEFELMNINDNATLIISGVSLETREIKVQGNSDLATITVKLRKSALDEVQVVAYGTTTRRFNTGNTYTVKSEDIENQPVTNPLLALQGRVPGLTVTQSTGVSGGAVSVRIQGRNNLDNDFSGSDPLIVADGVPYPSQNAPGFITGSSINSVLGEYKGPFMRPGSTLSFINPMDIESIDVLKDADATAIYGSRAANGAILITTKKGKSGETRIDIDFQRGIGTPGRKWDMLDTKQYLEMRHEAKANDQQPVYETDYDLNGLWDTTRYTDWQKGLIGNTADYTRASASASGGSNNIKYLVGSTYSNESTVFPGQYRDIKTAIHFNVASTSTNNRFKLQFSGNYLIDDNKLPGIDYTQFIGLAPVAPEVYNEDGTLNWAPTQLGNSTWENPLSHLYNQFEIKSNNLIGNALISYRLLPGLEVKSNFGYNHLQSDQFLATLDEGFVPEMLPFLLRSAVSTVSDINTWIAEPQITYNVSTTLSKIDVLGGMAFQQTKTQSQQLYTSGFSSDDLLRNPAGATASGSIFNYSLYRYTAFFARLNYTYKNRYILNVAGRRDGSSRFGPRNIFENFGSIAGGWVFSDEPFFKRFKLLSFGKIRGSYGVMGNDQIGDYAFMTLYSATPNSLLYQGMGGLTTTGISNPFLQWEKSKKMQVGIDIGFGHDKILLTTNHFRNRSSNSLTVIPYPINTGVQQFLGNFPAVIENSGLEFSLAVQAIKRPRFFWTANINMTVPKNKLASFPGLESSAYADRLVVGQPMNVVKTFNYYGINPQNGEFVLRSKAGQNTETPDFNTDRIALTRLDPSIYGGIQNVFSFDGFVLDFLMEFVKQRGLNYPNLQGLPGSFDLFNLGNQPVTVLDRWQQPGDVTNSPRYKTFGNPINGDWPYRDASFMRLKNVSLSYKFNQKIITRIRLKGASIYINGQNVLTLTKYKGLDPQTQSVRTLPPLRVFVFGVRVSI